MVQIYGTVFELFVQMTLLLFSSIAHFVYLSTIQQLAVFLYICLSYPHLSCTKFANIYLFSYFRFSALVAFSPWCTYSSFFQSTCCIGCLAVTTKIRRTGGRRVRRGGERLEKRKEMFEVEICSAVFQPRIAIKKYSQMPSD